jgi:hypothetical protein
MDGPNIGVSLPGGWRRLPFRGVSILPETAENSRQFCSIFGR